MQIDSGIQANCSEATMRILLDGQNEKKIQELDEKLRRELGLEPHDSEWDGEEYKAEYDFSEGYVAIKEIFGVRVMEITGDAPYNMGDAMEKLVKKYLPKAKIEWNEG